MGADKMRRVLFLTNSVKGLYNFRSELIQKLSEEGYKVIIAAPHDKEMQYFINKGYQCIKYSINRRGINPFIEFKLIFNYINIVKLTKPDLVLTYTIKPNVYGGLTCRLFRVPYIANITGLGTSIDESGLLKRISLKLYKEGLRKAQCVFFQNDFNRKIFEDANIVKSITKLIPGSGVNIKKYKLEDYPDEKANLRFLFIGRIMKAKGIDELLEAVKIVKEEFPEVHFDLIGGKEEDYAEVINELEKAKIVQYHGRLHQEDVREFIIKSHVIIHPSYHEGMSNVLLEAAATGRPVLASDVPGCREIFKEGVNGFGFEAKNVNSLVEAIIKFIKLSHEKKKDMGLAGRKKIEREFDRKYVINAYMDEINETFTKEN